MQYVFKPGPELVWALIVAIVGVLSAAVGTGAQPSDIKVWAIALVPALIRAILGVVLQVAGGPPNG